MYGRVMVEEGGRLKEAGIGSEGMEGKEEGGTGRQEGKEGQQRK